MAKTTAELIDDNVAYLNEALKDYTPGSPEHHQIVEDIAMLQRLNIEANRNNDEWEAKAKDLEIKEKELKAAKRKHKIDIAKDIGIAFGTTIFGIVTYKWGVNTVLGFEETGTIGSNASRAAIQAQQQYAKKLI